MAALPMPDEFRLFRFDSATRAPSQVSRVVEWVVHKNGLYNMLEMAAMKRPFASGIGAGGRTDQTVNISINRMMRALEQVPSAVATSVVPHLAPFMTLWSSGQTPMWTNDANNPFQDNRPGGGFNEARNAFNVDGRDQLPDAYDPSTIGFTGSIEDAKLTYRLAPEGRLSLVVQTVENAYAMIMARIAASHPIISLFDPYIVTGQEGKAGTTIPLAAAQAGRRR